MSISAANQELLYKHGADLAGLISFDGEDAPDLLPYATLTAARRASGDGRNGDLRAVIGVYEWQKAPLAVLVDGEALNGDEERLQRIRRIVAMRGDAPYIAVLRPGGLTVHFVALDGMSWRDSDLVGVIGAENQGVGTFPALANRRPKAATNSKAWVTEVVLDLLSGSIDALIRLGLDDNDAVSLTGRALFARFLADRDLLPAPQFPTDPDEQAKIFDDAETSAKTSRWLDLTFNGDFLPMSPGLFNRLPRDAFSTLGDIMRRAPGGQLFLDWKRKWDHLDFAHIPVGVLSQAYEAYMRKHLPEAQRKDGSFYTPRPIAEMMTRAAFAALRADGDAAAAKVLDPAAGAGVFLLTAFRALVAERWRRDGRRPDTLTLRNILYEQIRGFDINEQALRLAALGLYLMSIELDPAPEPVEKLRFENLREKVLFRFSGDEEAGSLGSLGPLVGQEHVGVYDLVIGNPPWSHSLNLPDWSLVAEKVKSIAAARITPDIPAPRLPNEAMDLPFVWRAMEWARPNGQIALAVHGRNFFRHGDGLAEARRTLFAALEITGVINGADLRRTKVWPGVTTPFCLLFARNQAPGPQSGFRLFNPRLDPGLNEAGGMRINADDAEIILSEQVVRRPETLKILFNGGAVGLEVYERMLARALPTLGEYWGRIFGGSAKNLSASGRGYQKLCHSSRVRNQGDGEPGEPAEWLDNLPELSDAAMANLRIRQETLIRPGNPNFHRLERVHHRRKREIYQAPLLVVHKTPTAENGRIRAVVSAYDLRYDGSYYGYSTHRHTDGARLARYLALVIGSKPAFWCALLTSGEFGFERDTVEKFLIESFPLPPLESLPPEDSARIEPLFDALAENESAENWAAVDAWVAKLYGLTPRDLQVIDDTLAYNLPFARNRKAAATPPTPDEMQAFCDELQRELAPLGERYRRPMRATPCSVPSWAPWNVAVVTVGESTKMESANSPLPAADWEKLLRLADQTAASELIVPDPAASRLWLVRLNQARYWSRTQARTAARRIFWDHIGLLSRREGL